MKKIEQCEVIEVMVIETLTPLQINQIMNNFNDRITELEAEVWMLKGSLGACSEVIEEITWEHDGDYRAIQAVNTIIDKALGDE